MLPSITKTVFAATCGKLSHGLAAGVLLAAGLAGALRADTFAVPNGSFEGPQTGYVSINIDNWQKNPKPAWYQEQGGFLWTQLTGIFKNTAPGNSDHLENCDLAQAIWLFAVPE